MPLQPDATPPPAPDRQDSAEITDPHALRALTHPVRIALIEALAMRGPLTATRAGEFIGESATTCSYHLRQLAKYGFVEEGEAGPGRQRPWKLARYGLRYELHQGDAEVRKAASAVESAFRDHYLARLRAWYESAHARGEEGLEGTGLTQVLLYVTPQELTELHSQLMTLLLRYVDRLAEPAKRPEDALAIEVLNFIYPIDALGLESHPDGKHRT